MSAVRDALPWRHGARLGSDRRTRSGHRARNGSPSSMRRVPTTPRRRPRPRRCVRSGAGLARLGRLLALQLASDQPDVLCLTGRTVLETWLGAHAAVLLGDDGVTVMAQRAEARRRDAGLGSTVAIAPDPAASGPAESPAEPTTLAGLARRLDLALYGVADPPKAFQRHLRSFFDEVDVFAVEAVDDPEAVTTRRAIDVAAARRTPTIMCGSRCGSPSSWPTITSRPTVVPTTPGGPDRCSTGCGRRSLGGTPSVGLPPADPASIDRGISIVRSARAVRATEALGTSHRR